MRACYTWTDLQDAWLRAHALEHPVPVLVEMMREEFDITRSYEAIAKRKNILGLQEGDRTWLSSRQAAALLGVGPTFMLHMRRAKLIPTCPANSRGRPDVGIYPADLAEFVRREHLRFTPESMPSGRYRSIVEMEYRTHRYMTVPQVARALGIGSWTDLVRSLFKSGKLPAVRIAKSGSRGGPRWVVKQADVLAYRVQRERVAA